MGEDTSKFAHQGLPPVESFNSSLRKESIYLDTYNKAVNVYSTLKCETFLDYHLTYLKCAVLQLADFIGSTTALLNYTKNV